MSVNYRIYEWDIDAGEVHVADVIEQLDCVQFWYDSAKECFLAATNDRSPLGRWEWTNHPYLYRGGNLIYVGEDDSHKEQ